MCDNTSHTGDLSQRKRKAMVAKMTQTSEVHTSPHPTKFSENEIRGVPLADIFVDADWNARSFANVTGPDMKSDDKDAKGFEIKESIRVKGQDTPVVIAPSILGKSFAGKDIKHPYQLVAGFCRYAAVQTLNADEFSKSEARQNGHPVVPNTPDGTIRAVVRVLDPKEARSYNVRENTARKSIPVEDTVHAIREMHQVQKMTIHQIAVELGMTDSYTTKLVRLSGLPIKILKHWREGGKIKGTEKEYEGNVNISTEQLDTLTKIDTDRQVDAYIALLLPGETTGEGDNDNQWIEAGKKSAKKLGFMLGALQRLEFLEVNADTAAWAAVIVTGDLKVTGRKDFSKAIATKFAKAAEEGYGEGLAVPEEEPEAATEKVAKGKGGNGKK
jgi:ParB-like chromosome segregation protein Spo0J